MRLLLVLLALAFVQPANAANACSFAGADTVYVGSYIDFANTTSHDSSYLQEPAAWTGETFWQGDDSAAPFGEFFELSRAYAATYRRGNETVGMIDVRLSDTVGYALLMDESGKVPNSVVWHGCAAIAFDLTGDITPLAWFVRGLIHE